MASKAVKIWYWIATILFGAFMLFSGAMHLIQNPDGVKVMTDLGYPLYLNYILGVAKILGVIALFQTKYKTLKEWAYAGFTFDILGASASFALAGMGIGNAIMPLVFLVPMITSYCLDKKMQE